MYFNHENMKKTPSNVAYFIANKLVLVFPAENDHMAKLLSLLIYYLMSLCLMIIFFAFDKWQYYQWFISNVVTVLLKKASLLCISVAKSGLNGSKVKDFLRSKFCIFRIALLARQNLCCISPIIGCEMLMLELMCTV